MSSLPKISSELIKAYQEELMRNSSVATARRKLISLKKFTGWARTQGIVEPEPEEKGIPAKTAEKSFGKPKPRNWYERYRSIPGMSYLSIAVLTILGSILGLGIYNQFIRNAETPLAFPTSLVRPNRYLSFQGRLTNQFGNPITAVTSVTFKLYDDPSAGTLLWTGTCNVSPDPDGVFSILLGSGCGTELTSNIFSENSAVWLGVTVATDSEATPRIQIATVAYALNSETLQGFPIDATGSATKSTVVTMNSGGELVIAESGPSIRSVSGNFGITGQALTLSTPTASNGNITISPGGTGQLNLTLTTANPTGGAINATDANLATGALYFGSVANNNNTFNLLQLQSGSSPTDKFIVDYAGNTTIAGNLDVNGTTNDIAGTLNLSGNTLASSGDLTIDPTGGGVKIGTGSPGTIDLAGDDLYVTQDLEVDGTIYAPTIYQGANQVCDLSGNCSSVGNYWQLNNKVISPANSTHDLAVGGTATGSATFQVFATSGDATMSGVLTVGNGTINAVRSPFGPLTLQAKTGANAWTDALTVDDITGYVGIGTTSPANILDVAKATAGAIASITATHGGSGENLIDELRFRSTGVSQGTNDIAGIGMVINTTNTINLGHLVFNTKSGASSSSMTEKMRLTNGGLLGINTTSPTAVLDVNGTATVSGILTVGNGTTNTIRAPFGQLILLAKTGANSWDTDTLVLDDITGYIGMGTTAPTSPLHVVATDTSTGNASIAQVNATFNPSSPVSVYKSGLNVDTILTGSNANTDINTSIWGSAHSTSNGNLSTLTAYNARAYVQNGTGNTISNLNLFSGDFWNNNGSGTTIVSNANGLFIPQYTSSGTTNYVYGVNISAQSAATNNYGINVGNISGGTTNYALVTNAGNVVLNQGSDASSDLRVEGDNDANLLFTDASADKVGIGDSTPDAKLEVLSTTEQLRLTHTDDTTDCRFTLSSTGDMELNCLGSGATDQLVLGDADTLNIGSGTASDVAYNIISDAGGSPTSGQVASDNDLYVQGTIEGGSLYQGANQVCDTSGNCGSVGNYWQLNSKILSPANSTYDLTIGGTATGSAFQAFGSETATSGVQKTISTVTTTGNVLEATASAVTTGNLVNIGLGGTSAFSGNGILVEVDPYGAGSFTGNFLKLNANAATIFSIGAAGVVTLANGETVDNSTNGTVNIGTTTFKLTGGTDVVSDQTSVNLFNTTTTTLNIGGAATTLALANGNNAAAINIGSGTGGNTINVAGTGATGNDTVNIGTGATGSDTITVGNANGTTSLALTSGTGDVAITSTDLVTVRPTTATQIGNATDYVSLNSSGDITFVDADGAASITGPAGGALTVAAGASQALTLTGNAASVWSTTGGLTLRTTSGNVLVDTATAGDVTIGPDTSLGTGDDLFLQDGTLTAAVPLTIADTALNAGLTQAIIDAINDVYDIAMGTGGSAGFWQLNNKVLAPANYTHDLAIGSSATASAKFQAFGSETETSGIQKSTSTVTTTGNVVEATSSAITSGNILKLGQGGTSAFSGTGLLMDFNSYGGGSFTGDYFKLNNNGVTQFKIGPTGVLTFANGDTLTNGSAGTITLTPGSGTTETLVTATATTVNVFNTVATTLNMGGSATTALNIGNGSGNYAAINIGSGTGTHVIDIAGTGATAADTVNIGTGGTGADTITIGNNASTTSLALTSGTGDVAISSTDLVTVRPTTATQIGNATDYMSLNSSGDITFVDADGAASITGPAGGALSVLAGASQALTLTGNAASVWSTTGGLTLRTTSGNLLLDTATAGDVTIGPDISLGTGDDLLFQDGTMTAAVPLTIADTALNGSLTQAVIDAINDVYDIAVGSGVTSGFWNRVAGNLYPSNLNDTISATTSAAVALTLTQTGAFNAFLVQDQSSDTSPFVIDQSGNVGIGTPTPLATLEVLNSSYISNQVVLSNGIAANTALPGYPGGVSPQLVVRSNETSGSRPLWFGYQNGASWDGFIAAGACESYTRMCFDMGTGSVARAALHSNGATLNVGGYGGAIDVDFTTINIGGTAASTINIGNATTTTGVNVTTGTNGFDLIADTVTTGTGAALSFDALSSGTGLDISHTGTLGSTNTYKLVNIADSFTSNFGLEGGGSRVNVDFSRSFAGAGNAHTDILNYFNVSRTADNTSSPHALIVGGSLMRLAASATETSGNIYDTSDILKLEQNCGSGVECTGNVINATASGITTGNIIKL